ncbi:hypothetical protein, partial [Mesorhizobium sp. B2-4-18]|uniref:hypothetical protein n=1 Tax=Mesorhizobium sp. B2-4-18 TaxID=2589931 RepID=UPI001AEEBF17
AMADELISAAKATPKSSFFIVFLLHFWCPVAPISPESPFCLGNLSRLPSLSPGCACRLLERQGLLMKQMFRNERTKIRDW